MRHNADTGDGPVCHGQQLLSGGEAFCELQQLAGWDT